MGVRALRGIVVASSLLGGTAACTTILGIEDVRLRSEAGALPGDERANPEREAATGGDADARDGPTDSGPPGALQVAQGYHHTCARRTDGTVHCWGENRLGQVGDGASTDAGDGGRLNVLRAQPVPGLTNITAIGAGDNHTCGRKDDGTVWCWGYNYSGQLGNGETLSQRSAPVQVSGINDAVAVEGGSTFTCALRAGGGVACWGANYSGQLGNGTKGGEAATPVPVAGVNDAVALGVGDVHACVVRRGGAVACWGGNLYGQLGNGTSGSGADATNATPVTGLNDATSVVGVGLSTCALRTSGAVACWGYNKYGQLGKGSADDTPNPTPANVMNVMDATALGAGFLHVCALRGAIVSCWGRGIDGQLGSGATLNDASTPTTTPVQVAGLTNAIGIGSGSGDHTCAPTANGALVCWGKNDSGQLGDGNTGTGYSPVPVAGFP
jgi:alpha-tubulin suppressor-like RCC1 family protein